jgi:hypothetical protein
MVVLFKSDLDVQQTRLSLIIQSLSLAPALGVTKFISVEILFWSGFVVLLMSDLNVQQTCLSLISKSWSLAPALG